MTGFKPPQPKIPSSKPMGLKPPKAASGWQHKQAGQISIHADGTKWKKNPNNTWEQIHDGGAAKGGAEQPKKKTYEHGQVATISGKSFMKVAPNRYAPVVKGKNGEWTHDQSRHGIEIHKHPQTGKVSYSKYKAAGHEVIRASMKGEEKKKSALHQEHKLTPEKLKAQQKELARNPVKTVDQLRPGHIVRVKLGSTIGKEDQRKEGVVGTVKKIVGNVAHIANEVGKHFEVPLHTLAMAKSKKDGLIELREQPEVIQIMLKALSRE